MTSLGLFKLALGEMTNWSFFGDVEKIFDWRTRIPADKQNNALKAVKSK